MRIFIDLHKPMSKNVALFWTLTIGAISLALFAASAPQCGLPFLLIAAVYGWLWWRKRSLDTAIVEHGAFVQDFQQTIAPMPIPKQSEGVDELFLPDPLR